MYETFNKEPATTDEVKMCQFFRGWRRKAGVVTLAMACVFAAGWVRSRCFEDVVAIPLGQASLCCVSLDDLFVCGIATDVTPGSLPPFPAWKSRPFCSLEQFIARASLQLHWQTNGFGMGELYASTSPFNVCIVPYWSIVIPLTLLSAYLLLNKPGTARQTQSVEPASAGGS